ncbi:MAG: hypothetical protein OEY61_09615 [Gammaproteobacteria bacterium]|nr:hypothetical protein [Gammaproteobacteria bacterium]
MKMFWILLILAILFVVGSASMMRYFDGKAMAKKDDNKKADD